MLSIPIVVMSCIPSTIFPLPPHFLENDVVSETYLENAASLESFQGNQSLSLYVNIASSMWTNSTKSNTLVMQTVLWLT